MRWAGSLQALGEPDAEDDHRGDEARDHDRREDRSVAARVVAQVAGRGHSDTLGEDEERTHPSRDRAVVQAAERRAVETREQRRIAAHRVAVEHDVADQQRDAAGLPEEEDPGRLEAEADGGDAALVEAVEARSEAELADAARRRR